MSAPTRRSARPLAFLAALFLGAAFGLPADTFSYFGDTATMALASDSQHALLSGHALVQTQDLRITADRIELFGKDLIYVQCSGNVHVVDTKRGLDLTSEKLFYDRDRKIARITGNAVMADLENQIVARGGFIEDRDPEQLTIIQIGVRIFKNDIQCRAEFARYYRDRKVLELSGMPWVSKGSDIYVGARITIDLDTEEISAEGSVSGTVQQAPADQGTTQDGTAGEQAPATQDGTSSGQTPPPQDGTSNAKPPLTPGGAADGQ